jgi:hypothetical protein
MVTVSIVKFSFSVPCCSVERQFVKQVSPYSSKGELLAV